MKGKKTFPRKGTFINQIKQSYYKYVMHWLLKMNMIEANIPQYMNKDVQRTTVCLLPTFLFKVFEFV